jgi:hypothetical protein
MRYIWVKLIYCNNLTFFVSKRKVYKSSFINHYRKNASRNQNRPFSGALIKYKIDNFYCLGQDYYSLYCTSVEHF